MSAPAPAAQAPALSEAEKELIEKLKPVLRDLAGEPRRIGPRRLMTIATPEKLRDALRAVQALGCRRLSAISAVDMGETIDVIYHACAPGGILVSIRVSAPRKEPRIPTVTDIMPAANLYEREIRDLFGVEFVGHPDPRRLMLYEGWPEGQYPLRKDWKPATPEGEKHA